MENQMTVFLFMLSIYTGQNCDPTSFSNTFISQCDNVNNKYHHDKDCHALWELFRKGFYGKEDSEILKSSYDEYTKAASHGLNKDKVTFYSGLKENGIKEDLISISRTMLGGPVNGVQWIADPVVGYRFQNNSESDTETMFWRRVSEEYATLVEGKVRILLDGTRESAFKEDTIMATEEIPNLNSTKVKHVTVYVVASDSEKRRDSCAGESLIRLRYETERKSIIYCCIDNQTEARRVFCPPNRKRTNGCCDCWTRVPDIVVNKTPKMSAALWPALIASILSFRIICAF